MCFRLCVPVNVSCVRPLVYLPGNVDNPPVFSPPAISRIGVVKKLAPSVSVGWKAPPLGGRAALQRGAGAFRRQSDLNRRALSGSLG